MGPWNLYQMQGLMWNRLVQLQLILHSITMKLLDFQLQLDWKKQLIEFLSWNIMCSELRSKLYNRALKTAALESKSRRRSCGFLCVIVIKTLQNTFDSYFYEYVLCPVSWNIFCDIMFSTKMFAKYEIVR